MEGPGLGKAKRMTRLSDEPFRPLRALSLFATTLAVGGVAAAELARFGAASSASAADTGLTLLLVGLLPLALTLCLLRFEPEPHGLVVLLGQSRKTLVLRAWAIVTFGAALFTVICTAALLIWTRTPKDPRLTADLLVSLPISLGAVCSTIALFAAARAWGGKLGLIAALILSWTLGQSDVVVSALLPNGHVRHLLGVGEPLPISPSLSAACLAGFCALYLLVLLRRVPS